MKFQLNARVEFLKKALSDASAEGYVVGNSGGKDCALTLALICRAGLSALSVAMPCGSKRNYGQDLEDAKIVAEWLGIENLVLDLTPAKVEIEKAVAKNINIAPRLRMTALYALAQERGFLVAGTGNLSEITMGYFTKWGDGAYDVNPIADLTATEVLEFLKELGAPREILEKQPSAGLFDGQTDESDMGVTYGEIDEYICAERENRTPKISADALKKIQKANILTAHKRALPKTFLASDNKKDSDSDKA